MMNNAIIFFDECEIVFKSRNLGSDRVLNSLLTEIERYEGIVFMATNRPHEIDEAMHRRITMVLEYREPDITMRKMIWDNILGLPTTTAAASADAASSASVTKSGLPLAADVNTSILAAKYQMTGGFIKNAVLSALLSALSRSKDSPEITQDDLVEGSKMQMRGNLVQRAFEDKVLSSLAIQNSLQNLFLPESDKKVIQNIVNYEKTRSQVYGSWNMAYHQVALSSSAGSELQSAASSNIVTQISNTMHEKACINLIAGNRGSGKSTIVKTVAFELGEKRMKWLHVSDFINQNLYEVVDIFRTLVKDARIMDAVIVIDGFEHILDDNSGDSSNNVNKIHILLSRVMEILYDTFHGSVFLLAHIESPQNVNLHR
jgi:SpoVK/Ycf46/Vps4 family AAA+-type ATPase